MAFKFLVLGAVLAVASAGVIAPVAYNAAPTYNAAPVYSAAPVYAAAPAYVAPKAVYKEPEVPKNYDFGYVVNDPKKHDFHSRHESRHNGVVQGTYSLIEKDGSRRIVDYTADPHTGFHAVVRNEPAAGPVAYAAPVEQPAPYYH